MLSTRVDNPLTDLVSFTGGYEVAGGVAVAPGGTDYKITLARPPAAAAAVQPPPLKPPGPSVVTSTNPKTPSPNLNVSLFE